jgi:dienelactone hydrolase
MSKKPSIVCVFAAALALGIFATPRMARAQAAEPVQFKTADGVTIYGAYYPAKGTMQPMILLFHQAGANRYEYAPIAPKLVAVGFSCLAIDQRWGGEMFGHENETVQKLGHAETAEGNIAHLRADLEAAFQWARQKDPGRTIILWGSSYSASLIFPLAAEHPQEVSAVLAFSPGEYFEQDPRMIRDAAAKVHGPVFITSENDPERLSDATRIFEAVDSNNKVHYNAQYAVHGSATLREDRNPQGAAANWRAVMHFLAQFSPEIKPGT